MKVYESEKAIVRIHPGKLSDEERRIVLEEACREFFRATELKAAQKAGNGKTSPNIQSFNTKPKTERR